MMDIKDRGIIYICNKLQDTLKAKQNYSAGDLLTWTHPLQPLPKNVSMIRGTNLPSDKHAEPGYWLVCPTHTHKHNV